MSGLDLIADKFNHETDWPSKLSEPYCGRSGNHLLVISCGKEILKVRKVGSDLYSIEWVEWSELAGENLNLDGCIECLRTAAMNYITTRLADRKRAKVRTLDFVEARTTVTGKRYQSTITFASKGKPPIRASGPTQFYCWRDGCEQLLASDDPRAVPRI